MISRRTQVYNVNLKIGTPLLTNLYLNGYLGASRGKTIATADNYTGENSYENSFSYGAGVQY
ncbi:MAG: hypothetical protein IE889_07970 [Campylobacterales bacterium]|nr:hypothetical protein [Campylobacterales bacterium]